MEKKNLFWKIASVSCAVLLAAAVGLLGYTYLSQTRLQPDSADRSNQPTFIDPVADLKVQGSAIADSWFVVSNLKSGDHEFGVLAHMLKNPGGYFPTIAITDVTDGKYLLDESQGGGIASTASGFEVNSDSILWSADGKAMNIQGTMKSGDGSFDLTLTRKGPDLAYDGTGNFPQMDSDWPTWEYAFPSMETTGTITVHGKTYPVVGSSWFDRQWWTKPQNIKVKLGSEKGDNHWMWVALRMSNGDVLAIWDVFGVRERTWANILHPDGTLVIADAEPLNTAASGLWTSEKTSVSWPTKWNVKIPGTQTELVVTSTGEGQETTLGYPRLESVIHAAGTIAGESVTGEGYFEIVEDPQVGR